MHKVTCYSRLSYAVMVWNTVQMTRLIDQSRAHGETITDPGALQRKRLPPPT
jgi:hypothetical protein